MAARRNAPLQTDAMRAPRAAAARTARTSRADTGASTSPIPGTTIVSARASSASPCRTRIVEEAGVDLAGRAAHADVVAGPAVAQADAPKTAHGVARSTGTMPSVATMRPDACASIRAFRSKWPESIDDWPFGHSRSIWKARIWCPAAGASEPRVRALQGSGWLSRLLTLELHDDPRQLPLVRSAAEAREREYHTALSETGLYADIAAGTLAAGVDPVRAELRAVERRRRQATLVEAARGRRDRPARSRRLAVPDGHALLEGVPQGEGSRIETRLLHKIGPNPSAWIAVAYLWNDTGNEAIAAAGRRRRRARHRARRARRRSVYGLPRQPRVARARFLGGAARARAR